MKQVVARFLWSHPALYRAVNRTRFREDPLDRKFDLLFDGFPRSGNTYGSTMLRLSQQERLEVITHQHKPSIFFRVAQSGQPACLTVRAPLDAIPSWVIYTDDSIASVIDYYVFFYQVLLSYRSQFLVLHFQAITENFPLVVRMINARFGLDLSLDFDLEVCRRETFVRIDNGWKNEKGVVDQLRVPRPDSARSERKKKVQAELLTSRYTRGLKLCEELHEIYEREFTKAVASLPPLPEAVRR